MLGVVIGVASVVLLVSIGSGARDEVTSGVESLGSNILFVAPGNLSFGSAPAVSRLGLEDVRRIGDAIGDPRRVAATVASGEVARVGTRRATVNVQGTTEEQAEQLRSTMVKVFTEAVTLVSEARRGLK